MIEEEREFGKDKIFTLIETEQNERNIKNYSKSLECCISILSIYFSSKDYNNFIHMLKTLSTKNNQSSQVILQMIKFANNKIFSSIDLNKQIISDSISISNKSEENDINSTNQSTSTGEKNILLNKFLETTKQILEGDLFFPNLPLEKEKKTAFFNKFIDFYKLQKHNEIKQLIIDFNADEFDELNSLSKNRETALKSGIENKIIPFNSNNLKDNYASTISNKSGGKLEITTHANLNSSMRKISISPLNKISGYNDLTKDNLKFLKKDLPFAKLAADVTLTVIQINKSFISEMKKQGFTIIGSDNSEYVKAEKKHFGIVESFMNCFKSETSRGGNNSQMTSIVLTTQFSDVNKFERILLVFGEHGKKDVIIQAIEGFFKRLRSHGKKIRPLRVQDVNSKLLFKPERSNSNEKNKK